LLGLWGFGSQGGKVPFDDVQMWSFIVKVAGCDNPVSELLINELVSSTPNDVRFKTDWIDRLKGCGPKMLEPMPHDPGTGQGDANGRLMKS
jgi:hypothetical protein